MKNNILLVFLLFMISCSPEPSKDYRVINHESSQELIDNTKTIDITELLEKNSDSNIPEFKEGSWAIAVYSDRTGYTYFYDQSNNLLGKQSGFQGNPREDLIHKRLGR